MSRAKGEYIASLRTVAEDASHAWWRDKADTRDETDVIIEAVAAQVLRGLMEEATNVIVEHKDGLTYYATVIELAAIREFATERGIDIEEGT